MARGEALANRVDGAVLDLAEAVLLAGREGEVFDAVVVDEDAAARASSSPSRPCSPASPPTASTPATTIRVRLDRAPTRRRRTVAFERVG